MIALLVILGAVGILAAGLSQNMRYGNELGKYFHSNSICTALSGVATCVAIVGIVMMLYGKSSAVVVLIGVAATILLQLPALKRASDDLAKSKKVVQYKTIACPEEPGNAGLYKSLGPLPVFFRLTLIGLGKVMVMIMYISLIGIPIYRGIEAQIKDVERYSAQARAQEQLRMEYESIQTDTYINRARRENSK